MFLSTPPSRVATLCLRGKRSCLQCFYPRHPRGWRLCTDICRRNGMAFLSTPPSRVATELEHRCGRDLVRVSIHATLAGGDSHTLARRANNPCVSIHATLAGGDASKLLAISHSSLFLSTPPSRVATRAGVESSTPASFLSTPPSRVATSLPRWLPSAGTRFYPRHPRGWRLLNRFQDVLHVPVSIHAKYVK